MAKPLPDHIPDLSEDDWQTAERELHDREAEHDALLDARDRRAERGSVPFYMAYVERPSERERRLHRAGENKARSDLYPRRHDSQVTPLGRKAA